MEWNECSMNGDDDDVVAYLMTSNTRWVVTIGFVQDFR